MQALRFAGVGAIGFAVDAGLLSTMLAWGAGPLGSRAVSFPAAVACTYLLNRRYTFRAVRRQSSARLWLPYALLQAAGAATNVILYVLLVQGHQTLRDRPLAALAVAALCSMLLTYLGSRRIFAEGR